jgi:hypothetical protein
MTPEQLAGFIRAETAKSAKVVKESGATADSRAGAAAGACADMR